MSTVQIHHHDRWHEVVLNRPERKNAITGPLASELAAAIKAATIDDNCEVILLRGAGGAFCSGLDLTDFSADPTPDWMPQFQSLWRDVHRQLYRSPKTLILALERFAINAGAALAFAADLVVTSPSAFLQVGEVQRGMAAPYNLAWLNLRYPETLRAQLTLVGRRFSGEELKQFGIAYECVADADVVSRAQALAQELAAYPPGALATIKRGLRAHSEPDADRWFDRLLPTEQHNA
ncbi:MAG: enoyl-CoA hydratase/isomerase family protein [Pseudomonadales bacterium]